MANRLHTDRLAPSARPDSGASPTTAAARELSPARRATMARLVRYSGVSVVSTTTSLVTLGVLVGVVGVPATWSNVIATAVGTVPSFELNRRWVWNRSGRRSLLGQIVPFCALSFAGLALSTLAVGTVSGYTSGWGHWSHTAAVMAANVTAYGALWVVQYHLLNRALFKEPVEASGAPELTAHTQTAPGSDGRVERMLRDGTRGSLVAAPGGNDHG